VGITSGERQQVVRGSSSTAAAFGAEVSMPMEGRSLFFVVGRDGPPDNAVNSVGGTIVARLGEPRQALAVAPLAAHSQLRLHPRLRQAGPITINPQKFGQFAQMLGLDTEQDP